jgi:hypothetical protein
VPISPFTGNPPAFDPHERSAPLPSDYVPLVPLEAVETAQLPTATTMLKLPGFNKKHRGTVLRVWLPLAAAATVIAFAGTWFVRSYLPSLDRETAAASMKQQRELRVAERMVAEHQADEGTWATKPMAPKPAEPTVPEAPRPVLLVKPTQSAPVRPDIIWPQSLLRNKVEFTEKRSLEGGSSFIVQADSSTQWLVTESDLLGELGGIRPAIEHKKIAEVLVQWRVFVASQPEAGLDLVTDTAETAAIFAGDVMALRLPPVKTPPPSNVLRPRLLPPSVGEEVYIVGLPYGDKSKRDQYTYRTEVSDAGATDQPGFIVRVPEGVDTTGFCGAPILDATGEVVGVFHMASGNYGISTRITEVIAAIRRRP